MDDNSQILREYYKKTLSHSHLKRTEFAIRLNESFSKVAIDCGCGMGNDIEYLERQNYHVFGFDINPDSISICRSRFCSKPNVKLFESSFEFFEYPKAGVVIANSSLFFADSGQFGATWERIDASIEVGGVFAGDFMGTKDSWAYNYHRPTSPLSAKQVKELFDNFEIVRFVERDEKAETSLGKLKHWHTYSVVAIKRK